MLIVKGYNSPQNLDNLQIWLNRYIFASKSLKVISRPSKFDSSFKARVAIEALQEKETLSDLAKMYGVAPSVISIWKDELLHNSIRALETEAADKREIKQLKKKNERIEA